METVLLKKFSPVLQPFTSPYRIPTLVLTPKQDVEASEDEVLDGSHF
jgi:hypothetical protein